MWSPMGILECHGGVGVPTEDMVSSVGLVGGGDCVIGMLLQQ